jgi:DNA-binding IclR family transcriptional regulator
MATASREIRREPAAFRTTARIGVVYPAHMTSGGKALLAELERIRARGYATNFGESELGIHAVAVAQHS